MSTLESSWLVMAVHLWQTALFVSLVALLAFTLRGSSARVLSALYWTGILKLLLPLPLLGPLIHQFLGAVGGAVQVGTTDSGWGTVTVLMYPLQLDPQSPGWSGLPPALYVTLTAVWGTGVAMILLRRIARRSRPELGLVNPSLHGTLAAAGLSPSQVRIGPDGMGPHVRGGRNALVVLPAELVRQLDPDELLAVLIHEREHLGRRDTLRYEALALVRTFFWFYPPVWWLTRRILETTEMSCDDAVVRTGLSPATYCRSLARTLTLGLAGENGPSPVGALGHRVSFLCRRLERIRSGRRFESMFKHRLTVVAAALAALAFSLLPVAPTPLLHAQGTGLTAGEGLDSLADVVLPVAIDLEDADLGTVFEVLSKASGVEFRIDEELAERHVTVEMGRSPLKLVLQHIGMVAAVTYEVVDDRTVQVRPVLLAGTEGVTPPVLIQESMVQPDYPEQARKARIEGRVILQARIGLEGNVGDVQVLEVDPIGFEPFMESAVKAVGQWRYRPAMKDAKPVDVDFTIMINFKLDEDSLKESEVH